MGGGRKKEEVSLASELNFSIGFIRIAIQEIEKPRNLEIERRAHLDNEARKLRNVLDTLKPWASREDIKRDVRTTLQTQICTPLSELCNNLDEYRSWRKDPTHLVESLRAILAEMEKLYKKL